jgi:two-component system, OmpR family, response regulator VicR
MKKILIAEDEDMLSVIIRDTLEVKGFQVKAARNGNEAVAFAQSFKPDLIVLDVMMPELNGYEAAIEIRRRDESVPIIFLTAKTQATDVLKGFDSGANDYMRKPFSLDELIARINVQLKSRNSTSGKTIFQIGRFEFDAQRQLLTIAGEKKSLSFKETQVLAELAENINQVIEKDRVLNELWNGNSIHNSRNMDVVITRVRQYLKTDEKVKIINIRGIGYKLTVEE